MDQGRSTRPRWDVVDTWYTGSEAPAGQTTSSFRPAILTRGSTFVSHSLSHQPSSAPPASGPKQTPPWLPHSTLQPAHPSLHLAAYPPLAAAGAHGRRSSELRETVVIYSCRVDSLTPTLAYIFTCIDLFKIQQYTAIYSNTTQYAAIQYTARGVPHLERADRWW